MPDIMNFDPNDRTPTVIDRILRTPGVIFAAAVAIGIVLAGVAVGAWFLFTEQIKTFLAWQFGFSLGMMVLCFVGVLSGTAVCILAERKIAAWIQDRKGPNRVGFWGLVQPMADGLKFLLKEEFTPLQVDKPIFLLAPVISFVIAFIGFIIMPWAGEIRWPWMSDGLISTQVVSLDIGVLYILATGGLGVYGVVLAGWASNNKYSFYGGIRAAAQMISYEVPLGLAVLVVLLLAGTLRPEVIVEQQAQSGIWFVLLHPLAFLLLFTCALAEANRAPFDLAECEQELVGGFHTEYSSMKFAMFFLGEYAHIIVGSALLAALFLGGWAPVPFMSWYSVDASGATEITWWNTGWIAALIKLGVYLGKIAILIALYMIIRWTLPRFRFDQLMRLAWKGMIPIGLMLVVAQGVLTAFGWVVDPAAKLGHNLGVMFVYWGVNLAILVVALVVAGTSREPITGRQSNLPNIEVCPPRVG